MNTFNIHLNLFRKLVSNYSKNEQLAAKLNFYETTYMHMANRNPVNLFNNLLKHRNFKTTEEHSQIKKRKCFNYFIISNKKKIKLFILIFIEQDIFSYLQNNLKSYFYQLIN